MVSRDMLSMDIGFYIGNCIQELLFFVLRMMRILPNVAKHAVLVLALYAYSLLGLRPKEKSLGMMLSQDGAGACRSASGREARGASGREG